VNAWCSSPAMISLLSNAAAVAPTLSTNLPVPLFALHGTRSMTITNAFGPVNAPNGSTVDFTETDAGDGTVPLASGAAEGITATGGVQRFAIPFGGHAFLFDDQRAREIVQGILSNAPSPAAHFSFAWDGPMYTPGTTHPLVVAFTDLSGVPIPGATVTLTLPGLGVNNLAIPQDPVFHDYKINVTMPGPGTTSVPYVVNATAPGVGAFSGNGHLVAVPN